MKLIMTRGLILVVLGVIVGLGASFALSRVLKALLFGIEPTNPLVMVSVSVGLTLVALLACYIPARRATKVDPLVALRYE
jgi:putative ABC transport system permease protein